LLIFCRNGWRNSGKPYELDRTRNILNVGAENRVDIARAVQHAEDVDAIREWHIENHIAANGKASQIICQIVASMTNLRILGKCSKFFVELVDERICLCFAVVCMKSQISSRSAWARGRLKMRGIRQL
jgi:hypothetical protein